MRILPTCPVDAEAWGKENRVQLHQGRRNVWTFARNTDDRPDLGEVRASLKSTMVKLFHGWPLDTAFADAGYAVDDIAVLYAGQKRPKGVPGEQRREKLPGKTPALLKSGPSIFVTVAFNYRGYETSMPWPVWGHYWSLRDSQNTCPVDADWILSSAYPLDKVKAAPAEAGAIDKLRQHGGPAVDQLHHLATLLKWGLYLYAGTHAVRLLAPAVARTAKRLKRAA